MITIIIIIIIIKPGRVRWAGDVARFEIWEMHANLSQNAWKEEATWET
jgi:hypothetical protein